MISWGSARCPQGSATIIDRVDDLTGKAQASRSACPEPKAGWASPSPPSDEQVRTPPHRRGRSVVLTRTDARGRCAGRPDDGGGMNIAVVRTTDIDEARRAMERVFLPMAIWPLEPLTALDMRLDSTQVDEMMASVVRFEPDTPGWRARCRRAFSGSWRHTLSRPSSPSAPF